MHFDIHTMGIRCWIIFIISLLSFNLIDALTLFELIILMYMRNYLCVAMILKAVMEVLRPDLMCLGLVSVSSLKGLGFVSVSRFKGFGLARDYSIETTRLERRKNLKKRHEKSTQSAVDSHIPSEKMMFFM